MDVAEALGAQKITGKLIDAKMELSCRSLLVCDLDNSTNLLA